MLSPALLAAVLIGVSPALERARVDDGGPAGAGVPDPAAAHRPRRRRDRPRGTRAPGGAGRTPRRPQGGAPGARAAAARVPAQLRGAGRRRREPAGPHGGPRRGYAMSPARAGAAPGRGVRAGGTAASSPLMEQYARVKADHPDAFLFFRLGHFYEMLF